MLELSGGYPVDRAYILQFALRPTTPCCLSDIEPQCQLLFRVGIVLLFAILACLVYLVPTVDDLGFFFVVFNIFPLSSNKIIFRTNQEMKLIIIKVLKSTHQ